MLYICYMCIYDIYVYIYVIWYIHIHIYIAYICYMVYMLYFFIYIYILLYICIVIYKNIFKLPHQQKTTCWRMQWLFNSLAAVHFSILPCFQVKKNTLKLKAFSFFQSYFQSNSWEKAHPTALWRCKETIDEVWGSASNITVQQHPDSKTPPPHNDDESSSSSACQTALVSKQLALKGYRIIILYTESFCKGHPRAHEVRVSQVLNSWNALQKLAAHRNFISYRVSLLNGSGFLKATPQPSSNHYYIWISPKRILSLWTYPAKASDLE